MDLSNELNRIDDDSNYLHSSPCYINADNGDIIDCPDNNDEKDQSSIKSQLIIHESINSLLEDDELIEPYPTSKDSIEKSHHHIKTKYNFITEQELGVISNEKQPLLNLFNDEENIILPEKIDLKDLNPYEPPLPQLLIQNKSKENEININNTNEHVENIYSLFDIEYYSTSLLLPKFVQNHVEFIDSFQQLWSPQVHSMKSIDSNTSESTLTILWSLIILLSKLTIIGFYALCSCPKILRYDTVLFGFCYLIGALFVTNAHFLIDFLFIVTCIISIFIATYEKWLFRYTNLHEYDNELNNNENENRYWRRIKLAAYGLIIGTILNYKI